MQTKCVLPKCHGGNQKSENLVTPIKSMERSYTSLNVKPWKIQTNVHIQKHADCADTPYATKSTVVARTVPKQIRLSWWYNGKVALCKGGPDAYDMYTLVDAFVLNGALGDKYICICMYMNGCLF